MNRAQFPLLKTITYLDTAAGTLKPRQVLQAMADFYTKYPINSRSDESRLGQIVSQKVKTARQIVASFVEAKPAEVIFTSGTTDGLNRLARMVEPLLKKGDEILLSRFNHSSNIMPFVALAERTGATIVYGEADLLPSITARTRLVAAAQVNNTLILDESWTKLYQKTRETKAFLINDAAQAVLHEKVSLQQADAIVFSSNKLYGPTGCGALVVREPFLNTLPPAQYGGATLTDLTETTYQFKASAARHEPGTLNTAGIIGLAEGILYHQSLPRVFEYERALATYAYDALKQLFGTKIYSTRGKPIILFNYKDYPSQDVVSALGHQDIILRGGQHCALLVKNTRTYETAIRLSLGSYNNKADVNKLIKALRSENFHAFLK